MAFAVVACSRCREPWAIELRHAKVTCPRCQTRVEVRRRTRLWQGGTAKEAQHAAARLRAGEAAADVHALADDRPVPRHGSAAEAAAAKANAVTNKSQKAEAVALWLTRLRGDASHEEHVQAMVHAGLERVRAEKEITRMLAGDVIFEPLAGHYRCLEA